MALNTLDFTTLVRNQVAAIQASARTLLDFTIGSVLRAIVESNSAVILWLQALILQLLATTRAATSSGADLDSFVADFGVSRLNATTAVGAVTFARFTNTAQAVVPIGATVQTTDGTQSYFVTLDTTNPAYTAVLGGYVIPAAVSSVNVPVAATVAGAAGNASAGQISLLGGAISGVDTVTNAAAFTGGADAESDAALRARFIGYISSLSKATKGAILFAVSNVQAGLFTNMVENQTLGGVSQPGFFYVVVDDGSGAPSSSLITSVYLAVDAVRPATVSFAVFGPTVVLNNVAMTVTTAAGYVHSAVTAQVVAAVQAYINSLTFNQTLTYTRLIQVAYDASPAVINVSALTINGATSDVISTGSQLLRAGTVTAT